jgi:predicted nucleic acid-binding Zn ribbon protein
MERTTLIKVLRSGIMLMTYCNFCGKELIETKYFCSECLEILGDLIVNEKYRRICEKECK